MSFKSKARSRIAAGNAESQNGDRDIELVPEKLTILESWPAFFLSRGCGAVE